MVSTYSEVKDMRWLYYLIPLGAHILFLPFWYLEKTPGTISTIEIVVGTILIPIYLLIVSAKLLNEVSISRFVGFLLAMLLTTTVGHLIGYFNWGISTGNILNPDSITIFIIKYQMMTSSIIITVGWLVACLVKSKMS